MGSVTGNLIEFAEEIALFLPYVPCSRRGSYRFPWRCIIFLGKRENFLNRNKYCAGIICHVKWLSVRKSATCIADEIQDFVSLFHCSNPVRLHVIMFITISIRDTFNHVVRKKSQTAIIPSLYNI